MSEHHPSCRPNDRHLIHKCDQCGLEENYYIDEIAEALGANRVAPVAAEIARLTSEAFELSGKWNAANRRAEKAEQRVKVLEAALDEAIKVIRENKAWFTVYRHDIEAYATDKSIARIKQITEAGK